MRKRTDILVIGSGIGGLFFAAKVAELMPEKIITVISKTSLDESNTKYAQGGIAAVFDSINDNYEKHIEDTIKAGDGLNKREVVEAVVKKAPQMIKELEQFGARFDKTSTGKFDLGKEGGHSHHRIVHHKDSTGLESEMSLLRKVKQHKNIKLLENQFAVDLLTQHHLGEPVSRKRTDIECYGAYVLDLQSRKIYTFLSKITVLATGGIGQVYATTTNPLIATGDGIAMAYRAKALVENMEFVQFHPTALYHPEENPAFLISEAVRGFGAVLKNDKNEDFVKRYDERGSLASRDIVARAIDAEMKERGLKFVYLDTTHLPQDELSRKFPKIYQKCLSVGINPAKDKIPVIPAAHYLCGGVSTDLHGRTSIHRLYCIGESANTGLHGANRLASNSLLEAMVFADFAATDIVQHIRQISYCENIPEWDASGTTNPRELVLITQASKEVKEIMSFYVGIVRSNERLQRALKRLKILYEETEHLYNHTTISPQLCELRNMINVAYLIITQSQKRRENKGAFFNIDLTNSYS
ncbi:MAG: L-aspartate oxidase [Bacteroidetes bacterium]|nr:MAG: L-aspartate oxidase [Bacteroidota bacterium]